MPQTITIGAFVLGAVLLLIGLAGGKFKIFSAEVESSAGKLARTVATILGICLVAFGLMREMGMLNGGSVIFASGAGADSSREAGEAPVKSTSGNTVVPGTSPPVTNDRLDLSGYWDDNHGTRIEVRQQGEAVEFYGTNSEGLQLRGNGTLHGNQLHTQFTTNRPSTGSGDAVVSSDGQQVSGSYYDTYVGQYSWTITRE